MLNASRRHGARHDVLLTHRVGSVWCSTPRGVMERGTAGPQFFDHRVVVCAQRLAASWSAARIARQIKARDNYGAQRLAASWSAAQRKISHILLNPPACSTPRGVMERGTAAVGDDTALRWVLNASRRHGARHDAAGRGAARRGGGGAQRLAASWSAARVETIKSAVMGACSTPRGVMERGTIPRLT